MICHQCNNTMKAVMEEIYPEDKDKDFDYTFDECSACGLTFCCCCLLVSSMEGGVRKSFAPICIKCHKAKEK